MLRILVGGVAPNYKRLVLIIFRKSLHSFKSLFLLNLLLVRELVSVIKYSFLCFRQVLKGRSYVFRLKSLNGMLYTAQHSKSKILDQSTKCFNSVINQMYKAYRLRTCNILIIKVKKFFNLIVSIGRSDIEEKPLELK